jgi:hypothetical protein
MVSDEAQLGIEAIHHSVESEKRDGIKCLKTEHRRAYNIVIRHLKAHLGDRE